jgi:hypothetical protein
VIHSVQKIKLPRMRDLNNLADNPSKLVFLYLRLKLMLQAIYLDDIQSCLPTAISRFAVNKWLIDLKSHETGIRGFNCLTFSDSLELKRVI